MEKGERERVTQDSLLHKFYCDTLWRGGGGNYSLKAAKSSMGSSEGLLTIPSQPVKDVLVITQLHKTSEDIYYCLVNLLICRRDLAYL